MSDEFDFSAVAIEEEPPVETKDLPSTCKHPGCGQPLEYGGRGPRPKYCPDHKRRPSSGTRSRKKSQGTDYTEGIIGMMQLPAGVLGIVGAQTNSVPLVADSAVITAHAPHVAEALNALAQERPEVAAVLDKVLRAGPYGAILGAVLPMGLQLLANHKVVPAGLMGTVTPEQVIGLPAPESVRKERVPDGVPEEWSSDN